MGGMLNEGSLGCGFLGTRFVAVFTFSTRFTLFRGRAVGLAGLFSEGFRSSPLLVRLIGLLSALLEAVVFRLPAGFGVVFAFSIGFTLFRGRAVGLAGLFSEGFCSSRLLVRLTGLLSALLEAFAFRLAAGFFLALTAARFTFWLVRVTDRLVTFFVATGFPLATGFRVALATLRFDVFFAALTVIQLLNRSDTCPFLGISFLIG